MQQQLVVGEGIICDFGGGGGNPWLDCKIYLLSSKKVKVDPHSSLFSVQFTCVTSDTRQSMVTAIPPPPLAHSR